MVNFSFYNPTQIEFGLDKEKQIGEFIAKFGCKKVLLCYGSERIKQDGLFEIVAKSLKAHSIELVEFGGIASNPTLSKVKDGIKIAKQNSVDSVLAIGGGSVLDSAKIIAAGAKTGVDVWDFFTAKAQIKDALNIFAIMTISATGSEMNGTAVITNEETKQKYSTKSQFIYPKLSVVNPELTKSVPQNYLAYSAVDIIAHAIEGYFTANPQPRFQSSLAESIVKSVIESTDLLLQNKDNYEARAQFCWCAIWALNGSITAGTGVPRFPNHMIEHSLSALFNIAHGAGLAIIIPAWMKWYHTKNEAQFKRFAKTIFNKDSIQDGIYELESWFKKIGAPISLKDANISEDKTIEIADNISRSAVDWGLSHIYTKNVILQILKNAK